MSVSARSYMSASLAVVTAGVLAVAPVTADIAAPRNFTADVALVSLQSDLGEFLSSSTFPPVYAAFRSEIPTANGIGRNPTANIILQNFQCNAAHAPTKPVAPARATRSAGARARLM